MNLCKVEETNQAIKTIRAGFFTIQGKTHDDLSWWQLIYCISVTHKPIWAIMRVHTIEIPNEISTNWTQSAPKPSMSCVCLPSIQDRWPQQSGNRSTGKRNIFIAHSASVGYIFCTALSHFDLPTQSLDLSLKADRPVVDIAAAHKHRTEKHITEGTIFHLPKADQDPHYDSAASYSSWKHWRKFS